MVGLLVGGARAAYGDTDGVVCAPVCQDHTKKTLLGVKEDHAAPFRVAVLPDWLQWFRGSACSENYRPVLEVSSGSDID